ncbi:T9SS type A sorting domain-containing protein [Flavobacterium sp. N1994]|uniref:T9SS type A sorting domain-containing protein n=1 Tax=Flavobacterium sp. N1994 TaxID=2986827 RepID=UPI002222B6A9|nr:T9SS type A sorting domain-containing protein [Flavobacterium sp. N1994]
MKNSTLFSIETRFKNRFYCCCESLKGNFKFLLVFLLFMGSFSQGVSAQGTLVPACNLIGPLEGCAVANSLDTSGDITINIVVARSGLPNLLDPQHNLNFAYSFPSNSSGAFIRTYGNVVYDPIANKTTQSLQVFPGTTTAEFNLQLDVTNSTSSPHTFCECSKSVSISKVAATSSYSPILCYGQLSTLTAVGSFSDVGTYTYTLLPSGPSNSTGIFPNLPGSVSGITYIVDVMSAEGCETTTSQTITQPAFNPVILSCPQTTTITACQTQDAVNTAFNNWLNSFSYTGGTNPSLIRNPLQPSAPLACGGATSVTWTVTDQCGQQQTCTSTFTVPVPPTVNVTKPQDSVTGACTYANQDAANAAFTTWLAGFTVSGGCSPIGSYGQPQAPAYCGGATTVTYTVSDKCYQSTTHTATFTITPAPAVNVIKPQDSVTGVCTYANQDAANAAFTTWLAGFTVSGGCSPVGSYGQPQAPAYCGGATTVTYTVSDKCYQTTTHTATFTITPAPAVNVTSAQDSSTGACTYVNQDAANAAFARWLSGFAVSGGCSPSGSFGEGTPSAPAYCGGSTTVTYTVSDKCYQPTRHTATFTITPAPAVNVIKPQDSVTGACTYANQDAANAAFTTWLAGFTVSGGCSPVGSYGQPQAPAYCGGATTVTYTVSDKCYQSTSHTATFTITPAPAVNVTSAQDSTTGACSYANQDAANAAFATWLSGFTVSGGCSPVGSFGEGTPSAPAYCGGATTVTYTVSDKCYQSTSHTATFTITPAPAVNVTSAQDSTTGACSYANQDAANAAFATWLSGFTVSGGCSPIGSYGQPQAPAYCGGATTVTYTVSDKCYQSTSHTATFTITPAPAVNVTSAQDSTTGACIYANQDAANAAFATWLAGFTVSGGCSPIGSYGQPQAPAYCGGSTTVTYRVSDKCYQSTSHTATFTITPAPAVNVTSAQDSTTGACSYANQDAANAAFATWLSGFTVSGGCSPVGSFGEGTPSAPAYCGGATTVTYRVTDKCYQTTTHTATFTITPAPAVNVTSAQDSTSGACSYANQDAANAAFATWLSGFTVSGGCLPVGSFGEVTPSAPAYCGGATTVTYTVSDKCYQTTTHTATFTITPAPAVNVTSAQDSTSGACTYANQDAANAAFATWLSGFTVSGGCSPIGSYGQPQAPAYCGGATTVTYRVTDKCYQSTSHTATFTITPAPAVNVTSAQDSTSGACTYANQDAANAAFATWLAGFTVSGGCSPVGSYGQPQAPAYCGGATTVTYTVSDKCYQNTTHSATFTITPAPAVLVNTPSNSITPATNYADQDAANAAFATWLAGFTVSGGCSPVGSYGQPQAPLYCGGSTTVTYTVSDKCYEPTIHIATFTITPVTPATINTPNDSLTGACTYADQDAANAAFNAWLAHFSVSAGINPSGSFGEGQPQAPAYCGGSTTVTYTVTDRCHEPVVIVRTFTITPAPTVNVTTPDNSTTNACSYANQDAANAAFATWLSGFTVSGGCSPVGVLGVIGTTQSIPTAPAYCGGSTTVTYTVSDKCYQSTRHSATFTITPAPAVNVTSAQDSSTGACTYANQDAANAAFATWLSGFTVSGGCSPSGSFGEGTPSAPAYCGGATTVTYTVSDKCYQSTSHTATFTITPAPAVNVTSAQDSSTGACTYANQDAANAAFATWLAGFTVSGGCSPSGSFGEGTPSAPAYCGGATTVTYTVSDKCYQSTRHTATFTITPAPAVNVTSAQDSTTGACSYANQDAANAAFATWLAGFTVSGGCSPIGSFGEGTPSAPAYCGGATTVTYTVSDKCYQTTTHSATFTITPAPAVNVTSAQDSVTSACNYANQDAANAAFATWLSGFTVSGGCSPVGSFGEGTPQAPAHCGGATTVTYTVSDKCYQTTTHTATFTISQPAPVVINAASNVTYSSCAYANQDALNAAFNTWLNGLSVSGGCSPVGTVQGHPTAPSLCSGGSVCVTYNVTDKCYSGSVTIKFTITPAPAVNVTSAQDSSTGACTYANQDAANAAFATWLSGFTVSGGCSPVGSFGEGTPSAPAYCGGATTVTYTVSDKCYQTTTHTATFTITPAPAVNVTSAQDSSTGACTYANQDAANAAFATWLAGFTVSGGCSPSGSFGEGTPSAPAYCGGATTVTYTVSDKCYQSTSHTATFTITPAPAVNVTSAQDSTTGACSYANQDAANAAFATWLSGFTVSGGCSPVGSFGEGTPSAPAYCGGATTVTYTVSDKCYQSTTRTATFTITPATPVVFNCGTNVTVPACSTQAQVNAAYASFLASVTASGGCTNGSITNNAPTTAPSACGGSVNVTWTYNVIGCGTSQSCTKTFTVAAPAPVVINCGNVVTLPACSTQAQLNAAWSAFLASTTATGGCNGVLTRSACSAPALCGGYVDVTWTYTVSTCGQQSGCGSNSNSVHCTRRFTVAAPAPVAISCGTNVTVPACSTQAEVTAAWNSFLASTTATGGCSGVLTNNGTTPPSLCGGYKDVTWTYTVGSCGQQSGCGSSNTVSCTKRFTVSAPAPVVFNCGNNVTVPACSTQSQLAAAWNSFLTSTTASGGCNGVLTRTQATMPSLCGGYVDVTWTYTVGSCGTTATSCGAPATSSNGVYTCTKRFTVAASSPVVFNCGTDVTVLACSTAAQVTTAWNAFLASTTASGGCNGVLTRSTCTMPSACGGYVDVTWTYTAGSCGGTPTTQSCTKRFTVAAPSQVVFNCGNNVTVPACSTAAQVTAAWNSFLSSTTASGGCNGVLTRSSCSAPSTCGGYVDVTWTYTVSVCGQQSGCGSSNTNSVSCTKRFTVEAAPAATLNCGNNVTVPSCSTQAQVNTAWTSFLASTTVSGGCSAGTLTNNAPSTPPAACGGYVDVTWTYRTNSTCGQTVTCGGQTSTTGTQTCTKRFTVQAATPATLNCASDVRVPSCSTQAQVNAAWASFLASTTVSGGCSTGTLTNNAPSTPPASCGGYVDVTWTYRTNSTCGQPVTCGGQTSTTGTQTCTKRFTVEAATAATLNCASDVTVPSCSSQAQINAAWASFLASTTVSGGCSSGTLTNNAPANAPSACGGYVDVTWTYRTNSTCSQPVTCGGQTSTTGTQTCTKRFTVAAAPAVTFNCGNNVTVPSCSTQTQVNCAWNSFLASTTVSGGCSTGTLTNNAPSTPPSACGGYVDVTWTYTAGSSACGQTITCGGQTTTASTYTCTKRFTVAAAPAVTFNCGNNVTVPACSTQAQVNCAWTSFLASTTVSGGCSSGTLTNNAPSCAPSACGGYVDVTWTYRTNNTCGQAITCGGQTSQATVYTCTKRFTVVAGGAVDVAGPCNVSYPATNYSSQYAVNCAFANWLAQFTTVSSGCGATAVFSGDCRVAPSWTYGGTVRVVYSITGNCNSDSVCATFTITRGSTCAKATNDNLTTTMTAKAYPNPFSSSFNLDVTTSSVDKVAVTIYDMTGKLIEQREVNADEVSGLQVGERFPAGVYNVIVSQGTEVKTLRVIKR